MNTPLEKAIDACHGLTRLATLIGATTNQVNNWRTRGVPLDYVVAIEKATDGAVTCEQLRPDKTDDFSWLRNKKERRDPARPTRRDTDTVGRRATDTLPDSPQ